MHSKQPIIRGNRRGFTLIEIMIVVSILALVASIGIPSYQRSRKNAQTDALMNELRVTGDAFQMYAAEKGTMPPTAAGFSAVPTGMADYMPKNSTWTAAAPGGGYWYWWNFSPSSVWGFSGLIGVYNAAFDSNQLTQIDTTMDDGDPNNGGIHTASGWVFYGVK
ncbi:MAG: type II secretion system protein [Chthoniobacteraceae bacterium]